MQRDRRATRFLRVLACRREHYSLRAGFGRNRRRGNFRPLTPWKCVSRNLVFWNLAPIFSTAGLCLTIKVTSSLAGFLLSIENPLATCHLVLGPIRLRRSLGPGAGSS